MLTVYKASAGSGKTYTLTFEYLKNLLSVRDLNNEGLLLNHPAYLRGHSRVPHRHSAILAITFTNAAADEMKSRIISSLSALSSMPDTPPEDKKDDAEHAERLCFELKCSRPHLRETAAAALSELLYDYGSFNVSTIDSFFQTVLRTFAREIDHQGDYDISLDTKDVIRRSLALMLDDINYSDTQDTDRLRSRVADYMHRRLMDGESFNFFDRNGHVISTLANSLYYAMDEKYLAAKEAIAQYLSDPDRSVRFSSDLRERVARERKDMFKAFKELKKFLEPIPEENINSSFLSRLKILAKGKIPEGKLNPIKLKAWISVRDGLAPEPKMIVKSDAYKKLLKSDPDFAAQILSRSTLAISAYINYHNSARYLSQLISATEQLEFVYMASFYLERYCKENNLLLISDTTDMLSKIISDAEMPFIYERLGMRLTNLMIDEFQDTSALQWKNLKPLVGNSISGGNNSLIIGDVKQAIYRFRNSDSSLLDTQVEGTDFPGRTTPRGNKPGENTNYRSAGAIVRFNNTLFRRLSDTLHISGYSGVEQSPAPKYKDEPAYIRLQTISLKPKKDKENPEETEPQDAYASLFSMIADRIILQHRNGYKWKDILVLAQKNKTLVKFISYILKNRPEIPVLSNEALLLQSSSAVRVIMSVLKLLERDYISNPAPANSEDDTAVKKPVELTLISSSLDFLIAQGVEVDAALEEAITGTHADARLMMEQIRNIRRYNPANIVALIEAIIHALIPPAERAAQLAYICALQDLAIKHCEGPEPSLSSFIKLYEGSKDSLAIKAPADLDAVQVMTVHKSKGLERPCVHIPLADWKLTKPKEIWLEPAGIDSPDTVPPLLRISVSEDDVKPVPGIWPAECAEQVKKEFDSQRIDSLNLAYVAFTRASRELCVYAQNAGIGALYFPALLDQGEDSELYMDTAAHVQPDEAVFEFGQPTHPRPPKNEAPAALKSHNAAFYPVCYNPAFHRLTSVDDAFAEHIETGAELKKDIVDDTYESLEMKEAARRGLIMHAILAEMETIDDLELAVARVTARRGLPAAEARFIDQTLREAIQRGGELVNQWFSPENTVFAERAIYVPDYKKIVNGLTVLAPAVLRPDRYVRMPDGSDIVIDYKFTSKARRSHLMQVKSYATELERIDGKRVKAFLWYPLLGKIVSAQ